MAEHVARLEETGALDASSSSSSSPASFNVKEKTHSSLSFYHGELLTLAVDIGVRLLPSFRSVTGIPYSRVNLIGGVLQGASR